MVDHMLVEVKYYGREFVNHTTSGSFHKSKFVSEVLFTSTAGAKSWKLRINVLLTKFKDWKTLGYT